MSASYRNDSFNAYPTIRSFSVDWWLWLICTGMSIGLVTRYVLLHRSHPHYMLIFHQCQNGWSIRHSPRRFIYCRGPLGEIRRPKDIFRKKASSTDISRILINELIANPPLALGSENRMSDCDTCTRLHGILQSALHGLEPLWSW